MLVPPLADRSRAKALVKKREGGIFGAIFDYGFYFLATFFLGLALVALVHEHLSDLSLIARNITSLILFISLFIFSIFVFRKLRSRHNRELEAIYAELFYEGHDEKLVVRMVSEIFMFVMLPMRPSESKKREIIKYKDELWKLDNPLGE